MKNRIRALGAVLIMTMVVPMAACGQKKEGTKSVDIGQSGSRIEQTVSGADDSKSNKTASEKKEKAAAKTVKFVDSAGRTVEIPERIMKVAPSGNLAQMMLSTIAPDLMVGVAKRPGEKAQPYLPKELSELPELGTFYGKNANMNLEAVLKAEPQVIIDIGEKKKTIKEDMDGLQKQLGIPVIFLEATLNNMDQAYITIGKLLNKEESTGRQAAYIRKTLDEAKEKSAAIADDKRVLVYYAEGDDGLATNPKGSIHADVIDIVGGRNVAEVEMKSGKGGEQISMEQLLAWNPTVIISATKTVAPGSVPTGAGWEGLQAVQNKKIYRIPQLPFSFMGRPPAVNRIIGIKWLGNLLYPDVFSYDMKQEVKEFYQLFYHCELTDEQVEKLLKQK
ncbi:MAG: ABC transporter substrate-binding protein [Lachnospiraceae bacterium]|nr:ABC transporter substrate-binding protein [Lachnospiraceae bacterium]MDY5742133.1 ABC transporter substrate-binding protein [Lachnospiraceae bacterium]